MAIEQIGKALTFLAFYTASGVGATGLTVTVDVRRGATGVVTDGAVTEIGGGLYSYTLASGSVTTENLYTAIFKTASASVDQKHLPALWTVGTEWVEDIDTAISAAPPTVGAVADAVLDELLAGHTVSGSVAAAISLIGTANGVISSPVTNTGELLVLSRGASYTVYSTMIYAGRLISGFVAASNPVKLFIKYNSDEQFVKTVPTADVSVTATNINVDISNMLTSAVTLGLKEGQFKAQLVGFNGTDNLQANVLMEFSVLIQPPLMDYAASDS